MTELPESFKRRMKQQLGTEYDAFMQCYEAESCAGLRVNTGRISPEQFSQMVPFALSPIRWTKNGYYVEKNSQITKHPYYYAGLYYIQEPSAMLPASRLPVEPGDCVLDLCAAPGGKATELASRLAGTGLLVANDASASRARALVKNLAVWGCTNCCITGETPERLLRSFGCFFDKILVDAPCSGEGMFRKDGGLVESWNTRGPETYGRVQKEILSCAVQMLKPGGMLLYSTCTFSEEEDEQVIAWAMQTYPELELVQAEMAEGLSRGNPPCEKAIRVWPHKVQGEGHFLALLRKKRTEGTQKGIAKTKTDADGKDRTRGGRGSTDRAGSGRKEGVLPEEVKCFLTQLPETLWKDRGYRQIEDQCFLLPSGVKLPGGLRYLRTGLLIGTCKKGRFEPSQSLAMALDAGSYPVVLNLSREDARVIRYLKGETLDLLPEESLPKGWVLICVDGFALGWGKTAGQSVKNKYYPGWRLQ